MVAMAFVSVQFRLLDRQHPGILKRGILDDRSLRGSLNDILQAFEHIRSFDALAGHDTNPEKCAISSNCAATRKAIARHNFGTTHKPCFKVPFISFAIRDAYLLFFIWLFINI